MERVMSAYNYNGILAIPVSKRFGGFSLLELMLSIAIMSLIMIGVIGYLAKQATESKITKAANEIKLLLQAGQAYYTVNPATAITMADLENAHYLAPSQVAQNPWGADYELTYASGNHFFGVKTLVPNSVFDSVLAKLPAAERGNSKSDKIEITSYVGFIPAKQQANVFPAPQNKYGAIRNAAIADGRQNLALIIKKLQCGPNETPRIFVAPAVIANKENKPITDVAAYVTQPVQELWYVWQKVNSNSKSEGNSKALVLAKCDGKQNTSTVSDNTLGVSF
jgi:type II secretory pathway pseudopilin PulG